MKTIEEAAQKQSLDFYNEIINNKNHFDCDNFDFKDLIHVANYAFKTAFLAGASFAQRWYDVNEELPENQDIVLIKSVNNCYATGYLHGDKSGFILYGDDAYNDFGRITHWRPIEIE